VASARGVHSVIVIDIRHPKGTAKMTITTTPERAVATHVVRLQGGGLRFLDAVTSRRDWEVVTRPFQGFDNTQHWRVIDKGDGLSTIQQVSSGRFLDAHDAEELDFPVVTRPQQDNDTQLWRIQDFGGGFITIQQVSSGRFLEATVTGDFRVVARSAPSSEQTWRVGSA
jgi:hypothetical protein